MATEEAKELVLSFSNVSRMPSEIMTISAPSYAVLASTKMVTQKVGSHLTRPVVHRLTSLSGITLPSKEAQVANIHAVYKEAGLDFDQTAYVECHGTGTQAGDWRELKAVSETLASVRHADNPIVVGSLKPNIGHLEGSAGIAGLIKGVLMLEQGKIPPNINFESGNPDIDFAAWKVKVGQRSIIFISDR